MKYTNLYLQTLKEVPQEAEVTSHQLMIRAGMIKKVSTGVYTWLPLGVKVLEKIKTIIREELSKKNCNELLLPILLPSTPWKKTGRWDEYGQEMFKLHDRGNREFCLGPTHEEIITETVKNTAKSYRDLPVFLYQIQTKFRDEPRPRFGVIRCKEFIMKDLYSFHADEDSLHDGYKEISEAYRAIFSRCGLRFYPVDADNGTIGGSFSHEYVSVSEVGETGFVVCDACKYSATIEVAPSVSELPDDIDENSPSTMIEVATPSKKTIEEVASFLNSSPDKILKSVLYKDEENNQYIAIVKGSDEVNETKLKRLLGKNVFLCTESTSLPTGFLGPVNAENIIIVADTATTHMKDAICGAMKKDTHCQHVCYKIDWQANIVGDIRSLRNGDPCPSCGKPLVVKHGMEIGHTFALNDRYTKPLKTTFTDVDGKQKNILMGCYGIGVTRLVAAIIEQYHDEKGIKWPLSVSPFAVEVIMVNPSDKDQKQIAESITQELENAGLEVLIDDREVSPGFKFKDSELLGIPYKVVCGRGLKENKVEFQNRKTGLKEDIPVNEIVKLIIQSAEDEMNGICNSSNSSL